MALVYNPITVAIEIKIVIFCIFIHLTLGNRCLFFRLYKTEQPKQ